MAQFFFIWIRTQCILCLKSWSCKDREASPSKEGPPWSLLLCVTWSHFICSSFFEGGEGYLILAGAASQQGSASWQRGASQKTIPDICTENSQGPWRALQGSVRPRCQRVWKQLGVCFAVCCIGNILCWLVWQGQALESKTKASSVCWDGSWAGKTSNGVGLPRRGLRRIHG